MNVGIPTQMIVRKNPHHLQITRTWFEGKDVLLTPFVIAWDAFILLACKMTFSSPNVDLLVVLFLLPFVSLGIFLTYMLLAGFLNKTKIDVTPSVISVKHSPIPVWGNKRIASKEIQQLFCKMVKMRNGLYWQDIISVHAIMNNENTIALLSGLKTIEQAMFMKQEIHNFLNIENTSKRDELDNTRRLFF